MMMTLGMFVFSLPTLAYQELKRDTDWKHPTQSIVGGRDSSQFTGKGADTITLSGWVAPKLTGSLYSLDALRLMADTGKAWILIQGTGRIYGSFVIVAMSEGKTELSKNGDPARVDFSITLRRIDQSVPTLLGGMMGGAMAGLMGKVAGGLSTKLAGNIAGGIASQIGGNIAAKIAGGLVGGLVGGVKGKLLGAAASNLGDIGSIKTMLSMGGLAKKANDLMDKGGALMTAFVKK